MKTHPILFSTPMVQAILEGHKTMTRRIIKPQPQPGERIGYYSTDNNPELDEYIFCDTEGVPTEDDPLKNPYGHIGDILWVRESFRYFGYDSSKMLVYKAGHNTINFEAQHKESWKPSIHMPKAACRIFLKITDIRVERLQDMSREDCKKEGVLLGNDNGKFSGWHDVFRDLWEKINGPDSWNANPWVWVISFERCEKPENF